MYMEKFRDKKNIQKDRTTFCEINENINIKIILKIRWNSYNFHN